MNLYSLRSWLLPAALLSLVACAGPRSEVEVYHLRDMVREGRVEYLSELVTALGAGDEKIRSSAIRALADLGEVAEPRLKQTVQESSRRSGPALLALGFGGNPDIVGFLRTYQSQPVLGPPAQEAEREIERRLYARISTGELDAMEAYLEVFSESPRAAEVRKLRRAQLARSTFEQLDAAPTTGGLEQYLKDYGDTEDAPAAKIALARLLVKDAQGHIERQEFAQARTVLERVTGFDIRREPEVKRLSAQSQLLEGKAMRVANQDEKALVLLEQAARFPEFRLEAERLQADILMAQARSRLQASNIREGIGLADRAARLDPGRRVEVATLKADLSVMFQSKLQSGDATERRLGLSGLVSLGDEAGRPMELYLGNLFARKNYAAVEEVVQVLADARRGVPTTTPMTGVDQVSDMLTSYLKAALATSSADMTRLYGTPEFLKGWTAELDPLDPRQYPLIYKVDELSTKHMGLSRVGLAMKALLGEGSVEIVRGALLSEDEVRTRLLQGNIGQDPALPLLTRVQLSGRYSAVLAELRRSVEAKPEQFMAYAVGLTAPPVTASDWIQVAEGYKSMVARAATGERPTASSLAGGLHGGRVSLMSLDFDQRSLTVQLYDPVVDALSSQKVEPRAEATNRTLTVLLNSARMAFGLFAGIDRYTVLLGSTETPMTGGAPVRGGRFDPQTRMMMSQKSFGKIDWQRLRSLNGVYTSGELSLTDLQWYRWNR